MFKYKKKCDVDSGSRLQLHNEFTQPSNVWLNLCSLRWLSFNHSRVRCFNLIGLKVSLGQKGGLETGWPFMMKFHDRVTFLIPDLNLFFLFINKIAKNEFM